MKKLVKNAVKCNRCGDIIESKTAHDYDLQLSAVVELSLLMDR